MRNETAGKRIMLLALAGIISMSALGCSGDSTKHAVAEEALDEPVSGIEIQWINGDITFEESDSEQIEMIQYASDMVAEEKYMTCKTENGILKIADRNQNRLGFSYSTDLVLYLPESEYEKVTADTVRGAISASNIRSDIINVSTTNGDISVDGTSESVIADTTNGDINVSCRTMPHEISVHSTNGDAILTLPEEGGFILNTKDEFESEFPLIQSGATYICETGDCEIEVHLVNGELELQKNIAKTVAE